MREILILILILGCFSTFALSGRGLFEFFDTYGRCWRCLPGQACVRCSSSIFDSGIPPSKPPPWDRDCSKVDPSICQNNLGVKFPSTDIRFYYICSDDGFVQVPCFCDRIFDYDSQSCIYADEMTLPSCRLSDYQCTDLWECNTTPPVPYDCPGATTPSWTTAPPNGGDTTTESTTTSLPNGPPSGPPNADRDCPVPTDETCRNNQGVKFPSTDIRFYYICSDDGPVMAPCFCDQVFQFTSQSCVYADELRNVSCIPSVYQCTDPWTCGDPTPEPYDCPGAIPPTTLPPVDTTTTTTKRPPWIIPTAPNESTTTTKPPWWIPTAPNETPTTTESTTTTRPPIDTPPPSKPPPWNGNCLALDPSICQNNLGVKFPSTDIRFYYVCADNGELVQAQCFCDQIFQYTTQSCVYSDQMRGISCFDYQCSEPWDCRTPLPEPYDCSATATPPPWSKPRQNETTTTTVPGNTPTAPNETPTTTKRPPWIIPTAPNETPSVSTTTPRYPSIPTVSNSPWYPWEPTTTTTTPRYPWIPTAPNETPTTTESTTTTTTSYVNGGPTTTTSKTTTISRTTEMGGTGTHTMTMPGQPNNTTRTTEMGGAGTHTFPGNSTTTLAGITTPAPCVCVVWWPCWCNPCWNMPCHSCNGCVGMMG